MATKWHLQDEEDLDRANDLLAQFILREVDLLAPDVIWAEVGSAITGATRGDRRRLSPEQGPVEISRFLRLELEVYNCRALLLPAYHLVHRHGCAIYDALYLALAEQLAIPFITADHRLFERIGHLPDILWLGDYVPSR